VADENMGRIVDVVVDRSGKRVRPVIDFGGFLAAAAPKIASTGASCVSEPAKNRTASWWISHSPGEGCSEFKDGKPVVVGRHGDPPPPTGPAPP